MQPDSQQSFQLAFRHLSTFSVAGIGTFVRKRVAAQVDHQSKRILPPQDRFLLEPGETQVAKLEEFYTRHFQLAPEQGRDLAAQVATWVAERLTDAGQVQIDGYGRLRKDEGTAPEFLPEDSIFGQTNDLFGLQAVDYTVGESAKPSLEKKKAAAQTSSLANQTVVEPVRNRRKFPFGWLMLLLILGVGSAAAWHWQDDLKVTLQNAGILKKEIASTQEPEPPIKKELVLSDSLEAIRKAMLEDSLAQLQTVYEDSLRKADSVRIAMEQAKPVVKPEPAVKPVPKPVVKPEPAVKPVPKPVAKPEPVVKPQPQPVVKPVPTPVASNGKSVGVPAQRGIFYLIVSSATDPAEAQAIAGRTQGSKILAPSTSGMHKISVFESAKKSDVIAKMVEYKARYSKSWIFWLGM
jgi:hypothetical protein